MSKLTTKIEPHDTSNTSARHQTDVEVFTSEKTRYEEPTKVNSSSGRCSAGEGSPQDPNIVDFDGPDDPENPLNWPGARKARSILIVSLIALLSPIGSTISASAAASIMQHFKNTDETLGAFVTTIYLIGFAFGPFVIAPLSELYGRAIMFRSCAVLFLIFNLACGVSNSFASLIVYRLLTGIAGSCPGTLGAGLIGDMIMREKRGFAMSVYIMGLVIGPTIGPTIGGYLTPAAGWRWDFWLMTISSGVVSVFVFLFLHESYPYVILKKKTARLRKETGNQNLRSALDTGKTPKKLFAFAILRPFKMLVSPIVFLLSAYSAVVYSYAYLCFTTFPRVFKVQYGFGSGPSGLASMGLGVGFAVGIFFIGAVSDPWSAYLAKKNGGRPKPEYRLVTLIAGAIFVPIDLFWYGWSAENKTHWIVPIVGTGFLGIGIVTAYSMTTTYLVDAYTVYSASVMAANTILRCLTGGLLPLAGNDMFDALGVGWGNSVLGFTSLAFLPLPLLFYFYGERIRESRRFKMNF